MKRALIVTAAGNSTRFGAPKLLSKIDGRTVLHMSLEAFKDQLFDHIVLTSSKALINDYTAIVGSVSLSAEINIIEGGDTRFDSVKKAVTTIPSDIDYIWVHDAARPFLTTELIERLQAASLEHDSIIPGVPETDTVKLVEQNKVLKTLDRSSVYRIQTPQVFRKSILDRVFSTEYEDPGKITDEAFAVETLGFAVHVVKGNVLNRKITFSEDI
jgi:2-C-methyl-D-erythritol 4-phosphate cytidylyltransferase